MNEIVKAENGSALALMQQRGGLPAAINAGAVTIEAERAIAEAKGQMQLAKMFPRDNTVAYQELMDACKMPAFAAVAFYSVPRAGGKVSGPSVRLAEEIARCYGNFEYGHRELSRSDGKSEVEVYAWDKEKNNRSIRQITVQHTMDTKEGPKKLRDQKDVDDKIANVASKQVRGRILALVPKWLVEAAVEECRKTLAGNNEEPISARIRMAAAFGRLGITADRLEQYLGHKLDDTLPDEIADLMGVFNAIRDGAPASDYFAPAEKAESKSAEVLKAAATAKPEVEKKSSTPVQKESTPVKAEEAAPAVKVADNKPEEDVF